MVRRWEYRPSRNLVRVLRYCQWSDHVWGFPSSCLLRYFVRCFLFSKESVAPVTTAYILLRLRRALRPSIRIFLPQKNHNNLNLPISHSHHLPQSLRLSCLCDVVVNSQIRERENGEEMGISAVSQSGSCAQVLPMERPCVGISILVSITILCTLFFLFKRICCPRNHSVHFVATT